MQTLRDKQLEHLTALLHLNSPTSSTRTSTNPNSSQLPTWKTLVLDKQGTDILSTSLTVPALREAGITLHQCAPPPDATPTPPSRGPIHRVPTRVEAPGVRAFGPHADHSTCSQLCRQLHSDRPALPDVPAIYFVSPTSSNVQRIAADLRKGLYASTYVNFTSALSRSLLEEFAETVAKDGTVEGVEQVRARCSQATRACPGRYG